MQCAWRHGGPVVLCAWRHSATACSVCWWPRSTGSLRWLAGSSRRFEWHCCTRPCWWCHNPVAYCLSLLGAHHRSSLFRGLLHLPLPVWSFPRLACGEWDGPMTTQWVAWACFTFPQGAGILLQCGAPLMIAMCCDSTMFCPLFTTWGREYLAKSLLWLPIITNIGDTFGRCFPVGGGVVVFLAPSFWFSG